MCDASLVPGCSWESLLVVSTMILGELLALVFPLRSGHQPDLRCVASSPFLLHEHRFLRRWMALISSLPLQAESSRQRGGCA